MTLKNLTESLHLSKHSSSLNIITEQRKECERLRILSIKTDCLIMEPFMIGVQHRKVNLISNCSCLRVQLVWECLIRRDAGKWGAAQYSDQFFTNWDSGMRDSRLPSSCLMSLADLTRDKWNIFTLCWKRLLPQLFSGIIDHLGALWTTSLIRCSLLNSWVSCQTRHVTALYAGVISLSRRTGQHCDN